MEHFICVACGTQFAATPRKPDRCPICEDDRQEVGPEGQHWTTLAEYRTTHRNVITEEEPGLYSIHPQPFDGFNGQARAGIGQRAFLVCTASGNLLWDSVPPLDDATVDAINNLGGLAGIAVSHPHFYTTMVEWSRAFGDVPIHLHALDENWVMRPDSAISFWQGNTKPLFAGLTLIHTGGHFPSSQILHWQAGADGRCAVLTADEPFVCHDRRWVSFMHSYPNLVPLGPAAVQQVVDRLDPLDFDRLYGAFPGQVIKADAKAIVARSAERYLAKIVP